MAVPRKALFLLVPLAAILLAETVDKLQILKDHWYPTFLVKSVSSFIILFAALDISNGHMLHFLDFAITGILSIYAIHSIIFNEKVIPTASAIALWAPYFAWAEILN